MTIFPLVSDRLSRAIATTETDIGWSAESYDTFCFFCQISNSTKKKDEFAFFCFFTFKGERDQPLRNLLAI